MNYLKSSSKIHENLVWQDFYFMKQIIWDKWNDYEPDSLIQPQYLTQISTDAPQTPFQKSRGFLKNAERDANPLFGTSSSRPANHRNGILSRERSGNAVDQDGSELRAWIQFYWGCWRGRRST